MILLALLIFTIFSVACGAATGMTELSVSKFPPPIKNECSLQERVVLRAFQGIGGSGIYSMVSVIVTIVIPPEKYGKYMAIISSVFVVASILGPVLGGAINDHSSWRVREQGRTVPTPFLFRLHCFLSRLGHITLLSSRNALE